MQRTWWPEAGTIIVTGPYYQPTSQPTKIPNQCHRAGLIAWVCWWYSLLKRKKSPGSVLTHAYKRINPMSYYLTVPCACEMWLWFKLGHDDVIKWKHFPRYWPFVRGIHRSPVNSPHKGQWRGALMFTLICARIKGWVNNREAGDLRRYRGHYDVTVMGQTLLDILSTHLDITLELISWDGNFADGKSILVQEMVWCRQAGSHNLNKWLPRSKSPYGVIKPQWVKCMFTSE